MNTLFAIILALNVKTVHFSFDDGPSNVYTKQILKILKDENVQANFFLVGNRVKEHPEIVREILADGHDIGAHSMTHRELTKIPVNEAKREIKESMDLVNQFQKTDRFRFPYGSFDQELDAYVKSLGYQNIYWDVDTTDWKYKDKDVICGKFRVRISKAKDGAIILMHDIHPQTVEALKDIIKYLKDNNVSITKIPL